MLKVQSCVIHKCGLHPNPFFSSARKVWPEEGTLSWSGIHGVKVLAGKVADFCSFHILYPCRHLCTLLLFFLQTLLLFTKQIKFSSRFSTFLVFGVKQYRRWSKENSGRQCLFTYCRNKRNELKITLMWSYLQLKKLKWFLLDCCTALWWWDSFAVGVSSH